MGTYEEVHGEGYGMDTQMNYPAEDMCTPCDCEDLEAQQAERADRKERAQYLRNDEACVSRKYV